MVAGPGTAPVGIVTAFVNCGPEVVPRSVVAPPASVNCRTT